MSGRWWRAYDEAVDDPKLIMLSDRAHRTWFNLMCIASANGGTLPDTKVVAIKLRMPVQRAAAILTELAAAGLFDRREDGKFEPHNWKGRQFQSDVSTERVKRFRERERNVSVTPPDTENRKQITETEKKETRASALADGWPPDFREQFWNRYPNKVGKPKAIAKLELCMRRGIVWSAIMSGLDGYIHAKPPDRAWLNPETFLNQERWADQPAAVTNGRRTVLDAADDLIAKLKALDEPPPNGLGDRTSEDVVRLLPSNRRG